MTLKRLFEEHFSYVYLYIRKLSHNEAIAEEITSETFFKALSAIDKASGRTAIYVCGCVKSQRTVTSPTLKTPTGTAPLKVPTPMFPDSLLSGPMEAVLSKETAEIQQRSLHGLNEPVQGGLYVEDTWRAKL